MTKKKETLTSSRILMLAILSSFVAVIAFIMLGIQSLWSNYHECDDFHLDIAYWSHNGQYVVMQPCSLEDEPFQLFEITNLTEPIYRFGTRNVQGIAWSPNDEMLVFSERTESRYSPLNIYRLDISTLKVTQLTDNDVDEIALTWVSDNSHIIVTSGYNDNASVAKLNISTQEWDDLTSLMIGNNRNFFTDGGQVAHVYRGDNPDVTITDIQNDTTTSYQLPTIDYGRPVGWSPNRQYLTIIGRPNIETSSTLVLHLPNSEVDTLVPEASSPIVTWSHDSQFLSYRETININPERSIGYKHEDILNVINIASKEIRQIERGLLSNPYWQDNTTLAYIRFQENTLATINIAEQFSQ